MNELKFDKIVKSNLEDITVIEYGIIEGNNTIVFIKSGQNGSIYGYNNKYIKMAKRLNKKYKCTVICSSNPFYGNNPLDNAFTVIEKCTSKFEDYKVYYLGFSNGALIGAYFGINYPKIKRMLLVNMPLIYDINLIKNNLNNFNNEKVMDYLTTKVIDNLKNNELNYIKIDYNENIGYGIDDKDSVGEGLRKHAENVVSFMKKITKEVPNLVLENCSSGGMRHEIVYNTIGSMVSFSDAHEIAGGAIIAMDLHRIMQPRIMQIWASILPKLSLDDIYFTMAKSMLGRICLSGQLDKVPEEYLMVVKKGVDFYNNIKNVIKNGNTTLIDTDEATSILHPHGVIRLVRKLPDDSKKVCYIFSFDKDARSFSFKENGYKLTNVFTNATIDENENITFNKKATCAVLVYEKEK